jgi:hypothetical protein
MEPEGSLLCSQEYAPVSYVKSDESSTHVTRNFYFNIILLHMPRSPKWDLPSGFSDTRILCAFLILPTLNLINLIYIIDLFVGRWDWVYLVRRPLLGILHQPRVIEERSGALGGMSISRENRRTMRKPAPVTQISYNLSWDGTRATIVESRRLTAWASSWP